MQSNRPSRALARVWTGVALLVAALTLLGEAQAQAYPNRPIKLVVPFTPGGTTDLIARVLAESAGKRLGQQIIVENRAGAGGNVGTEAVAKSAADGYTLALCTIGTCAINLSIYAKPGYDIEKDFVPVILVGSVVNVLVVNPNVPAKTVKELVALAKSKPDKLSYGSSGYGSSPHLAGELLKSMGQVEITHVPYKGSAPAIIDLRGGQIDLFFDNAPSILPQVKANTVRALATTGTRRSPLLPDVPTMQEAGFAGFVIEPWWGVVAPVKTPAPVTAKLNQAFNEALKDPTVLKRFSESGVEEIGGTPERLAAQIKAELPRWGKLVKERNIKAE